MATPALDLIRSVADECRAGSQWPPLARAGLSGHCERAPRLRSPVPAALQRAARHDPEMVVAGAAPTRQDEVDAARGDARQLWQAVRTLPRSDQEVIFLRYFLEMSEAEMAATLGVAPGTIKSRLHRALVRLRGAVERGFPSLRKAFDSG